MEMIISRASSSDLGPAPFHSCINLYKKEINGEVKWVINLFSMVDLKTIHDNFVVVGNSGFDPPFELNIEFFGNDHPLHSYVDGEIMIVDDYME
jgi:hypothetical protein